MHVIFGACSVNMELLKREVTFLAKLRHPNLVYFWGFCLSNSRFYIVTEFCPLSLEGLLKAGRRFENKEILKYLKQFQQALTYLHECNVLHRDLKPDNILFDEKYNLKVTDD